MTAEKPDPNPSGELPRSDFSMFVLSLGHSAMMHLGLAPHPETGEKEIQLLQSVLYELRMGYVKARG